MDCAKDTKDKVTRVESQYKNFWQNLVATFCPLFTCEKGTKCGDQVLSKIFVLWFYSRTAIYSNSERSEQFSVTEYFFNLFLEVSYI